MSKKITKVGFIGLGVMGSPMSKNIAVSREFDLTLFDMNFEQATKHAQEIGAVAVADAEGLAECDIIVLMLPTSAIVRDVLLDESGQPRIPARTGTVFVDMSSSDPTETRETGAELEAAGYIMIDAPVSGAKERAESGTLTIMLGANDEQGAQRAIPVINTMSSGIFRTGSLGTGHAMKALNNAVAAAAFAASAEALIAGQRFGLELGVMVDVFNASTGQSFPTTHVLPEHIVNGKFASGFALPLFTKDVRIAQKVQQAVGHEAPVCDAVTRQMGAAMDALGNVDHTRAFEFWREQ
ncbi:3-hydroxyisobutyrate dehydrogenase [Leucobacter exalbidus]|uniref:3-hydroxyisobutyrate dehydrogenase n=1 Tax=Leucobacter exalbidus TaxID=662960 RepID=A0A940PMF4_9MICO|nr:NAD(P)-dependent oxidoreductase [Leucobacter exalbidus]MBP1325823.1 3-hydroxyisobutyrate dehydrogenase [Leucobacter exalbidus]